jgi:dipeptidyl-peptidase-4
MSKGMEAADSFIVEYETVPYDEKITLKGYEMTVVPRDNYPWPRIEYDLDNPKDYVMPYYCKVIAKRSVKYPAGYLLDVHDPAIVRRLQQHGIVVERLYDDADLKVEEFVLREVKSTERLFQGHNLTTIKGNYQTVERTFAKGVYYVSTQQLRGNLAAYLLEPECNDGLITWNFFDNYLVRQWRGLGRYPVYKIHQPAPIVKRVVNQLK